MHRFVWDMRFDPLTADSEADDANGAVPHRTYLPATAPWVPPGAYTVRLTADGKSYTQPLLLRLDPRVKTPAAGLAQLATLSREMYDGAVTTHAAQLQARALVALLANLNGGDIDAFKAQVESLAPAPQPGGGRAAAFRRRAAPVGPPTLEGASTAMMTAAMAMQGADAAPTANEVAACDRARAQARAVMPRWTALRTTGLAALNARRKAAGQPLVTIAR